MQCANSQKVYTVILLHRQERDLAQISTNQRRRCQYRGYSCRTALDQLSKRCRKLLQGRLSPSDEYACILHKVCLAHVELEGPVQHAIDTEDELEGSVLPAEGVARSWRPRRASWRRATRSWKRASWRRRARWRPIYAARLFASR